MARYRLYMLGLLGLTLLLAPQAKAADPFAEVKLSPAAKKYLVLKDVNVRSKPLTKSKRVGRLRKKETIEASGKAKGTEWILVKKDGKSFGFVYGTALVPMIDGTLKNPISGNLESKSVADRKLPPCHYKLVFDGKVTVQGDMQVTSDYLLSMECDYKNKTLKISATMFLTELPYLDNRKPIYQINVDLLNISLGDEDVFSATALYNTTKKEVSFDGVSDKTNRAKGKIAAQKATDLPAALKATIAMAHQSWGPKIWSELAKAEEN